MHTENIIGKQVYATLPHEKDWDFKFDTSKVWTVISVKSANETDNWYDSVVIKDEDLNEKELPEYEVIIAPDYSKPEDEMLYKYLRDNGVYAEVWNEGDDVKVDISWGDWKHEHGWARNLMEYINYLQINVDVTEEDGSDTYSAVHTYRKFPVEYVEAWQSYREKKQKEIFGE